MDTPLTAGVLVIGALFFLILLNRGFKGVGVHAAGSAGVNI